MKHPIRALFLLAPAALICLGAETYQKPPKAIEDILNSPTTPTLTLSPNHAYALQGSPIRYPPIAELSEPMLRLAGIRINPKTNGLHNTTFQSNLLLRKVPEGTEIKIALPPNPKLEIGPWSPDGSHFVFTNSTAAGIEIWVGDTATGRTHRLPNVRVNEVFGAVGGGRGGAGGGGLVAGAAPCNGWPTVKRCSCTLFATTAALRLPSRQPPPVRRSPKAWAMRRALLLTKICCRIPTTKISSHTTPPPNSRW
jgi:hypothetical protein